MDLQDLVLMPETQARRALSGRPMRLQVLAPVGNYAGRGSLRVLRARPIAEVVELVCGYEAYEAIKEAPRLRSGPLDCARGRSIPHDDK